MDIQALSEQSAAAVIARFLKQRGVRHVYGLCGGHIMPIWMRLDAEGIRIVDVRAERAAVYMAHAEAELGGGFGVALVTAGPGVAQANADPHTRSRVDSGRGGFARGGGQAPAGHFGPWRRLTGAIS